MDTEPKLSRRQVLCASAALITGGCIPESAIKRELSMTPQARGDGWSLGTPQEVGLDPASVRAAYERVFSPHEFINALSLLVVSHGKLVAEGYVQSERDAARRRHIQSNTKSLTALAFGIRHAEGVLPDLDASIARYLDVHDEAKRAITLRQLLTMRSGIELDTRRFTTALFMPKKKGVTEFLLAQPLRAAPGSLFMYRDCDPQLVGSVLAATGESIEAVLRRAVFAPLGITDLFWEHTGDGEPLAAQGVYMRPRDLAKLGELMLRKGRWEERVLIDPGWVEQATSQQTEPDAERAAEGFGYGYFFYTIPALSAFSTSGHGGTFITVLPERELVVVLTSMPEAGAEIGPELVDMVDLVKTLLGA